MFHRHNYVESITDKNVIYCTICGKTKFLPCNHSWEVKDVITYNNIYTKSVTRQIYVKECTKCKKHITEEVDLT